MMKDLTEGQMDIIAFLKGKDGTTIMEVADHFGKPRHWAAVRLSKLHDLELVTALKEVRGQGMPCCIYRLPGGE